MVQTEIQAEFRREDLAAMSPTGLLAEATRCGLKVFAEGSLIKVRGPQSADSDLVTTLLGRKGELMPLLTLERAEKEYFDERFAIAGSDGGLSTHEAERLAWEEIHARRQRDQEASAP